jgi:transposase-like protein
MSIVTTPSVCSCGSNLHKHGKRKRHVIEQGEKVWYFVQRLRCPVCRKLFTLLPGNMMPYKHYAAPEIEQVLKKQENPEEPLQYCEAKKGTIRRWLREFPQVLTGLTFRLLTLAGAPISLLSTDPPLQRLYKALEYFVMAPSDFCRLTWALLIGQFHPV